MTEIILLNQVAILIALAIGLITGWWLFRSARKQSGKVEADKSQPAASQPVAHGEGDSVLDSSAAAVADVTGEFLGVDIHPELPEAAGPPDDLRVLKGVGPKLAAMLNENGITRFDQLAALNAGQIARLDANLGAFSGRITRDRLVEQAGFLASGDTAGFEAKFGKLGSSAPA